MIIYPFFVSV